MRVRRPLLAGIVTVSALLAVLLPGSASADAVPEWGKAGSGPDDAVEYVALGDSYTAGPLIPLLRLDPVGCAKSTSNYPSLLAGRLGVSRFTDVSCSAADTGDMTAAQSVPLGSNKPQLDALDAGTDLVTLGIGGNDHGVFGSIISTCPGLRDADPAGAPCREHFTENGVDTLMTAIADTGRSVEGVLREIRSRAPEATVLAVGYPRIAPESGYCAALPFAEGDYAWLNSIEEALNKAVSDAVGAEGTSSYVDTFGPSLGHDACAGGQAWINGKDTNLLAAASYHPFRRGMEGIAGVLAEHLG
ncbi:GDSL family lipase [Amycolatopsis antarctica]|uniref:GDSL family lipase n=1 Tax=Amycolatopsis antarctica TaxID=1854586 RepID=A0A263D7X9_9PSEU|nr:SGNH/GDSL hydrolase family protein [Amycolatopsis antarctica]OZM74612.1 GDSL family lipase [Amycolatopsis antarctica]